MKKIVFLVVALIFVGAFAWGWMAKPFTPEVEKSPLAGVTDRAWTDFVSIWMDRVDNNTQVIANVVRKAKPIPFTQLSVDTAHEIGEVVVVTGTIVQSTAEQTQDSGILQQDIWIDNAGQAIYVYYQDSILLKEGDNVTVYGQVLGRVSYQNSANEIVSLPAVGCLVVKVNSRPKA